MEYGGRVTTGAASAWEKPRGVAQSDSRVEARDGANGTLLLLLPGDEEREPRAVCGGVATAAY